jgi:soluble cytochrome b562
MITLEQLKNAVTDIKQSEKEWVQDSHTEAEYQGVCEGLDMLIRHFEELKEAEL